MMKHLICGLIALALNAPFISADASCSFAEKKTNSNIFEFKISDEACKLIKFNGETLATIHVKYPSMEIVSYKDKSENIITLMISPISVPPFDINRPYSESKVISSNNETELLDDREKTYRVLGSDGSNAYISEWQTVFVGNRTYKNKVKIRYIFKHNISSIKNTDEFVLSFLNQFLID